MRGKMPDECDHIEGDGIMKYVVLGTSAAGLNGAETLRRADPDAQIVLISTDTEIYSRCMLHLFVSGHRNVQCLNFKPVNFFEEFNIQWIKGISAIDLNPDKKEPYLSDGSTQSYDKLLIATGGHTRHSRISQG